MSPIDLSNLNWSGHSDLQEFVSFILSFAISLSGIIAAISVISAGFTYMLSMGNQDKISKASKSLIFSILGLIVVFMSPNIVQFILKQILGVK
ncbi:MAG TPA: hypothetical protein PLS56_02040 [Candidatus Dojkabacteria bacterium]|nr:hypothetical protein [Candidatus Dojkabacteria bacterium]